MATSCIGGKWVCTMWTHSLSPLKSAYYFNGQFCKMSADLVMDTEVLLKVESILGHPEGIPHISLHKLHPLDTLVTSEP